MAKTRIEINLLPVSKGDCIHIRFEDEMGFHNIIIDSGPASSVRKFRNLLKRISDANESIDLLCFTHIDDDHIGGATKVFSDQFQKCDYIQRVWLNCDTISLKENEKTGFGTTVEMSPSKMLELQHYLLNHGVNIENSIIQGHTLQVGTAEIYVLTPSQVDHDAYRMYLRDKLENIPMSAEDRSVTNGDSISLLLTYNGKQLLFTGDIHASELQEALCKTDRLDRIYCAQLPHHGSSRNLTKDLLIQMNTRRFLISSERDTGRPSQETIRLLEEYEPQEVKTVLCNFELQYEIKDAEHLKCIDLHKRSFVDTEGIHFLSEE